MKVLIAYQYFSFKGGIEHVITSQSSLLNQQGYEVALLTSEYLDNQPSEITPKIPINRIASFNYLYTKLGIPFAIPHPTPKNFKKIQELIRSYDVINVHGHPYLFSFIIILMAKVAKKPVILTQHNTKIKATNKFVDIIYFISDHTIGKYNIANSATIITVSDETRKYIAGLKPDASPRMKTIYNGIDSSLFKPIKNKSSLRKELGLPVDAFICFTVRRITFKNGIDTLLEAAASNKDMSIHFVIGGTGSDLEKAKRYINTKKMNNVTLLGFVNDNALPKYYAAADVFILPSRQGEGFPMVVLESFSSGLPVIATRSGGHTEIIDDSNGYLVEPESPTQIVEKIQELRSRDLLAMGKRCRKLILERFTWEANTASLKEEIHKVVEI